MTIATAVSCLRTDERCRSVAMFTRCPAGKHVLASNHKVSIAGAVAGIGPYQTSFSVVNKGNLLQETQGISWRRSAG